MPENIPIFIINLKKDIERREHMEELCNQYNLQYQFTDAIYGKNLDKDTISKIYNKEESIRKFGRELTKGELACVLSHINIYKHIVENDISKAFIFEDDIQIEKDFPTLMQSINKFPNDWELVLFGYHRGSSRKDKEAKSYTRCKKNITTKHKLVRFAEIATGAHGYLINLRGAKKLIDELSTIKMPMDYYTGDDQYINLYGVSPRVIRVNKILDNGSNLTTERDQAAKEYNHEFYRKKESIYNKFKKELSRPFRQMLLYIKRVFAPIRKYE